MKNVASKHHLLPKTQSHPTRVIASDQRERGNPVILRAALDCFVAIAPRNDGKIAYDDMSEKGTPAPPQK